MIAELYGKHCEEDRLTGQVFGFLRYLPFERGLKRLFSCRDIFPAAVAEEIAALDDRGRASVLFWEKMCDPCGTKRKRVEPDVLIVLPSAVICVEAKLRDRFSPKEIQGTDGGASDHQLVREVRAVGRRFAGRKLFLFLVGGSKQLYREAAPLIPEDVSFGFLSWDGVADAVHAISRSAEGAERAMLSDLEALLARKGFGRFPQEKLFGGLPPGTPELSFVPDGTEEGRPEEALSEAVSRSVQGTLDVFSFLHTVFGYLFRLAESFGYRRVSDVLFWISRDKGDYYGWIERKFTVLFQRADARPAREGLSGDIYGAEFCLDEPRAAVYLSRFVFGGKLPWKKWITRKSEKIFTWPRWNGDEFDLAWDGGVLRSVPASEKVAREYHGLSLALFRREGFADLNYFNCAQRVFGGLDGLSRIPTEAAEEGSGLTPDVRRA